MRLNINDLISDDLLAIILEAMNDTTQLRVAVSATCRRWRALTNDRPELWRHCDLELPHKKSRGRDRRNSYTTPCALNLPRLAAWLKHRAEAIFSLNVALLYPDAVALLPSLLPVLAPALRRLSLTGTCSQWPFLPVDWVWLGGMTQLERLEMWDALPGMDDLVALPPSLLHLSIDRVGEADPDVEGWSGLPASFARLPKLLTLMLGTPNMTMMGSDEVVELAPLRALTTLLELQMVHGTHEMSGVPVSVSALQALTLLSFQGCRALCTFNDGLRRKPSPLIYLRQLRLLDLTGCGLVGELPPGLATLPQLRTLLLSRNGLSSLPTPARPPAAAPSASQGPNAVSLSHRRRPSAASAQPSSTAAAVAAVAPAAAGGRLAAAGVLPLGLEKLTLDFNSFSSLPTAALACCCFSTLTELDLSRNAHLEATLDGWRAFLDGLPSLRLLRHSCARLTAESVQARPELQLECCVDGISDPTLSPWAYPAVDAGGAGSSNSEGLLLSLDQMEAAAAAILGRRLGS